MSSIDYNARKMGCYCSKQEKIPLEKFGDSINFTPTVTTSPVAVGEKRLLVRYNQVTYNLPAGTYSTLASLQSAIATATSASVLIQDDTLLFPDAIGSVKISYQQFGHISQEIISH